MLEKSKVKKDSFWVFDMGSINERINVWKSLLPRVEIFFAAKVLFDDQINTVCHQNGTGFDVASEFEMREVIKLGVNPEKCIYANPVK